MRTGFVLQQLWIQHTVDLTKALLEWEQLIASGEASFYLTMYKKNSLDNYI